MELAIRLQRRLQGLYKLSEGWRALRLGGGTKQALPRALLALALLSAATLWLWREASLEAQRLARARFSFKVAEARFAIEQRLKAYEQVLRGGVALFDATGAQVRRETWRDYVRGLDIARNYPGIQGIGFATRIAPTQLDAHVRAVRAEGFAAYAVRPAHSRDEYTAIVYLEPFDWRNQRAFGYDMFSEPVRRAAMVAARDSGQPAVSGKVRLVQETSEDVQSGFLMYLSVYRPGVALATPGQRRAALLGHVYAPFRMNDLMRNVLEPGAWREIELQIFDGESASRDALLYENVRSARSGPAALSAQQPLDFNGRRWTLHFSSAPAFEAAVDTQKPRLILFGGLLIGLLFMLVVWWSSVNRERARQVAEANRVLREEIAERTRLAAQLEQAKRRAEAASQAKGEFLANVSHELRTPLTLMLGPLEQLLAPQAPGPDWRAQTERVRRNALQLLNRVNDILDFSKAEAGRVDLQWHCVDLAQAFAPLMEDAAAAAAGAGCAFRWRIDQALGPVCVDPHHLDKIVTNFVSNALKFTPAGGRIDVVARPLDDEGFELAVSDTGIGIAAEDLPRLFERFHQVDNSATRRHGGTGIGLALAKELAAAMGGRVGVESRPGQGSRFFVQLRRGGLAQAAAEAAAQAPASPAQAEWRRARLAEQASPPAGAARPPGRADAPRVLFADDHADLRAYVAELLGEEYAVVLAEDGAQAWALLQVQRVDLVVSDLMMPNVDGLTLTARIKSSPHLSHLPVILLTARGGDQACVSGLASGADDHVAKPFSPAELVARVQAALRMSRIQAQLRERTREAGMAMLATGLLHHLGNALSGVTVSCALIRDRLDPFPAGRLRRAAGLLRADAPQLPQALRERHGEAMPDYLERLADHLDGELSAALRDLDAIHECVAHAGAAIATQQGLAGPGADVAELHGVDELMEAALALAAHAFGPRGIAVERDYRCGTAVLADRHKVLQILLNLLSNACDALDAVQRTERRVTLRTARAGEGVQLQVGDNGVGIEARHLPLLFNQGFTTKASGHGYGLHSSAAWAHELGGGLSAHSDGPGRGATFTLTLPGRVARETASEPAMQEAL